MSEAEALTYEREGHSAHSKGVIYERKVTIHTMNVTVDVLTVRFRSLRLPAEVDTFASAFAVLGEA